MSAAGAPFGQAPDGQHAHLYSLENAELRVRVTDYGIRGMHLAYDLASGYESAILIDAAPRGEAPGTVYVIEPDLSPEAHAADIPEQ